MERSAKTGCTAVGKIYDGASNTLMLSENINAGQTNWANPSLNSCGFMLPLNGAASGPTDTDKASSSLLGTTPLGVNTNTEPFINEKKSGPEGAPFPNSNHPGIVVVSMCDGSVKTLSENINKYVYTQLMTPWRHTSQKGDGARLCLRRPTQWCRFLTIHRKLGLIRHLMMKVTCGSDNMEKLS